MIRIEYRHYTATAHKEGMVITDWNGDVVYRDPHWNAADRKSIKADLKEAIDLYIQYKPYADRQMAMEKKKKEGEKPPIANAIIDYTKADQCCNPDVWYTCHRCGKCGRKFKNGVMIDDGGTTVAEVDDE